MNPKVSIIIPVYNAMKQLDRCIESVLKQDFADFELLLINDGSSDASGEICDKYATQDARIRVVHKENTGVSDSRNLGISLAKGEFLQFLDSDDWIIPEATGLLVRSAEKNQCEMVIAEFYRVVGERLARKGDIQEDVVMDREEFAIHMMDNPADFYYGVLWNKLYRRDIIVDNKLQMDKDISWCEDFIFNMQYIRFVKKVYALQVPIYYYVRTKGSLVSQGMSISKTIQMKRTVFKCYKEFYKDVFNEEDYEKCKVRVYRFLIDVAGDDRVPLGVFPSSLKLGDERISTKLRVGEGKGLFWDSFFEKKLLERYLEIVALKQDLTLDDIKLLYFLSLADELGDTKKIAEIIGVKRSKLMISLQKLVNREILVIPDLKVEAEKPDKKENAEKKVTKSKEKQEKKEDLKRLDLSFGKNAEDVLADILDAKNSYEQIKYAGLSEEEIEQYELLQERIRSNVSKALK